MQTPECRRASEQLRAYLAEPMDAPAPAEALSHVRSCAYCRARLGFLLAALPLDAEDALTCAACQDRLPEYLLAQAERRAGDAEWAGVALHLRTCPHCAAVYADLADMLALAQRERGVEPPAYPQPRLPFAAAARPALPGRWDRLGRLVIALSAEALRAFQPPQLVPGAALKAGGPQPLALARHEDDLAVTITVAERRDSPARCTVMVHVDIPSRNGWPHLAGSQVSVKARGAALVRQTTDAFGNVVFEDIERDALERLTFTIVPRRSQSE